MKKRNLPIAIFALTALIFLVSAFVIQKSKNKPKINTTNLTNQIEKSELFLIMKSEFANHSGDHASAIDSYRELFEFTKDRAVLSELIMTYIANNEFENALIFLEKQVIYPRDEDIITLQLALMLKKELVSKNTDLKLSYQLSPGLSVKKLALYLEKLRLSTTDYLDIIEILGREQSNLKIQNLNTFLLYLAVKSQHWRVALDFAREIDRLESIESDLLELIFFEFLKDGSPEFALDWIKFMERKHGFRPQFSTMKVEIFRMKKEIELALDTLRLAIETYPENKNLIFLKASFLIKNNLFDEAAKTLQILLKTNHRTNEVKFFLGLIAEINQSYYEAVEYFSLINKSNPDLYFTSRLNIARLMFSVDQTEKAFDTLNWLQLGAPEKFVEITQFKVDLLLGKNNFEYAMKILNNSLSKLGFNRDLMYTRAIVADKLGNIELLERDLREILTIFPEDADALNALGYSLTNLTTRYEEAYQLISKALQIKGDSFYILDSMGWICFKRGELERAIFFLEKAYELSKDEEITSHLIEVLNASGEHEKAKLILEKE